MKTRNTILGVGAAIAGFWAWNKFRKVDSFTKLLKIESPIIQDLGFGNSGLVFNLTLPVVNPEEQSFDGKIISIRLYKDGEEVAYSEPGVIPLSIASGSRTMVSGIKMIVPASGIDAITDINSQYKLSYRAVLEIEGVRGNFEGFIN